MTISTAALTVTHKRSWN